MNVAVTEWYVPGCPDCISAIETIVRSAVRDATVTKMDLGAGHRHNHPAQAAQKLVGPVDVVPTNHVDGTAPSPTLGDLFEESNQSDKESELPNGFDTQGRA